MLNVIHGTRRVVNQSAKWTVSPMQEVALTVTIKYKIVIHVIIYSINMSLL